MYTEKKICCMKNFVVWNKNKIFFWWQKSMKLFLIKKRNLNFGIRDWKFLKFILQLIFSNSDRTVIMLVWVFGIRNKFYDKIIYLSWFC